MEDDELRVIALQHATNDLRGQVPAEVIVKRAGVYYAFLQPMRSGSATTFVVSRGGAGGGGTAV